MDWDNLNLGDNRSSFPNWWSVKARCSRVHS